ncbi:hypothetical protein U1Q18_048750 [Sarracenia purpurea var. burkii]
MTTSTSQQHQHDQSEQSEYWKQLTLRRTMDAGQTEKRDDEPEKTERDDEPEKTERDFGNKSDRTKTRTHERSPRCKLQTTKNQGKWIFV